MPQETVNYDSVCLIIGRLIIQQHSQMEQYGKNLAQAQQEVNTLKDELVRLRGQLRQQSHEGSGTRTDNS
jgi:hypothetical protein